MPRANIAVIDDDEISLEIVSTMLDANLDVAVVPFSDSSKAREFLLEQTKDSLQLVISDMVMPNIDGLGLLRACRSKGFMCPFVFMTAFESRQTKALAKQLGALAYIIKPIEKETLLALCAQHINIE